MALKMISEHRRYEKIADKADIIKILEIQLSAGTGSSNFSNSVVK